VSRLEVKLGNLTLKNPVIAGSGEATISARGMRAALLAGAGAVVAKSTNEAEAAKKQLDHTDYMLFDSRWRPIEWDFNPPEDAQLFSRSGLLQERFDVWLEKLVRLDAEAKTLDSYVVGQLSLANLDECVRMAEEMQSAGLRVLEVMCGAVHGEQAVKGAISTARGPEAVRNLTAALRKKIHLPLWIKLPHAEDVTVLAEAAYSAGADAVSFLDRSLVMVPDLKTRSPFLGTYGAIGGPWALPLTCRWLARTRQRLGKDRLMIAQHGARDGYDVARMMLAGACAVQLTSIVMMRGTRAIKTSIEELDGYLAEQGVSAQSIIGEAADKLTAYTDQASRPYHWEKFVHSEAWRD